MWIRKSINLMFFLVVLVLAGVGLTFFTVAGNGAVFSICAGHSDDNPGMILFLLSRACVEPRPFLLFTLLCWRGEWGCM